MRQLNATCLTIALIACQCCNGASLAGSQTPMARSKWTTANPSSRRRRVVTALHGGGRGDDDNDNNDATWKDYGSDAASLFGNLRVPASLFAGASAGAAFAMPIGASESFRHAIVKRAYAVLMMGSLACQILAVIVATLAMGTITTSRPTKAASLGDYIRDNLELEWTTARLHFLSGILLFVVGSGLRAWVSIACSVVALASLGIIASSTLLAFAFISKVEVGHGGGIFQLAQNYIRLLVGQSRKDPLFAMAFLCSAMTWIYIAFQSPHIIHFTMANVPM